MQENETVFQLHQCYMDTQNTSSLKLQSQTWLIYTIKIVELPNIN